MSSDRRQIAWGLVDQGVSSATNFGGSILAARMLPTSGFGAFAIGFSTYVIVLGLSRSWSSDPLLIRFAASSGSDQHGAVRQGMSAALVVGAVGGIVLVITGVLLGFETGGTLVIVGLALSPLMLQDFCRYALIMQRRSRDAAANDLVWLVVLCGAFAVASTRDQLTPQVVMICWSVGGVVAAAIGLIQLETTPVAHVADWVRRNGDLAWRYSTEFMLMSGTAVLLTIALGAVGGLPDAARLSRGTSCVGSTRSPVHGDNRSDDAHHGARRETRR